MATDPFLGSVDLLLNFNGTDGQTAITPDIGAGAVTVFGDAQLDTAVKQFGTAALLTDGTGDYLTYGAAGDFDYLHSGSEDYTIEAFFLYGPAPVSSGVIIDTVDAANQNGIYLNADFDRVRLNVYVNGAWFKLDTITPAFTVGVMAYLSLTYKVGVGFEIKVDNASAASVAYSGSSPGVSGQLLIAKRNGTLSKNFKGTLDSIRITRGVARTISGIPTEEFPASAAPNGIISNPSPIGAAQFYGLFDFTGLITDNQSFYAVEITGDPVIRLPASSWQATLQTGSSNYVQCVIPAVGPYTADIAARQGVEEFVIYREITINGDLKRSELARAPIDTTVYNRGPTNYTLTMSGYAAAAIPPAIPTTRVMSDVRSTSISAAGKTRARCAIDWFLIPGDIAVVLGANVVPSYINYYATSLGDAYMDIGER